MWKNIIDILFPITCLGCGQDNAFLCPDCLNQIPLAKKQPYRNLIITASYDHPLLKEAILKFKYNFIKDLANPLSQLIVKQLQFKIPPNPILIPVPLHPRRLKWRGFNQAELLASEISHRLDIPLANNILIREKHNLPQVKILNAQHRKENIKKAFCLNTKSQNDLKNKTVILVDDVCTTGATLNECAEVLKDLKPKDIWGLVLAKG